MQLLRSEQQGFKESHKSYRLFSSILVCSLACLFLKEEKKDYPNIFQMAEQFMIESCNC